MAGSAPDRATKTRRKPKSRPAASSALSLLVLTGIAGSLLAWNAYASSRDVRIATGIPSPEQEAFFVKAADRPDILLFYQKLLPDQRLAVARNLGAYRNPKLVKLIAILLDSFDREARKELGRTLSSIARYDADTVSGEISRPSSFQRDAIFSALKASGAIAIPPLVKRLGEAGNRDAAIRLLTEFGPRCVGQVLPTLDSKDEGTRVAASDLLGKLRRKEATAKLVQLYASANGNAELQYLTAIANIGDPVSEAILRKALHDTSLAPQIREQAALGLGRVASDSAVASLEKWAYDEDLTFAQSVLEGLCRAGDRALARLSDDKLRLRVAEQLNSVQSDLVISNALHSMTLDRALLVEAIRSCSHRSRLVPTIVAFVESLNPASDGDLIDASIRALLETPQAESDLKRLEKNPTLAGWIVRARATMASNSGT